MVAPWKNPDWQSRKHNRYKCRCNKRSCQARVTRRKHPDEYQHDRYRMCPLGCGGSLYVDWFRMWKDNLAKDRGETCNCNGYQHENLPRSHRKGCTRCVHREEMQIARAMSPRPTHSPYKAEPAQTEAPF